MLGLLGALASPDARRALVIGLGTGSTAGWLAAVPSIDRVDVVDVGHGGVRLDGDAAKAVEGLGGRGDDRDLQQGLARLRGRHVRPAGTHGQENVVEPVQDRGGGLRRSEQRDAWSADDCHLCPGSVESVSSSMLLQHGDCRGDKEDR